MFGLDIFWKIIILEILIPKLKSLRLRIRSHWSHTQDQSNGWLNPNEQFDGRHLRLRQFVRN